MAKVKFGVMCNAYYESELDLPDNIIDNELEILDYIRDHLNECNIIGDLDWVSDLEPTEAVQTEDIICVDDGKM